MSTQDDELTARMYGADNVAKYNRNKRDGPKEAKRRFLAKYPYAIIDKFMFGVSVDKNADISSYNVMYIIRTDPTRVVSIKSKEFLDNAEYRAALKEDIQWEPLWDVKGTLQPFKKNTGGEGFDVLKFRIYVTKDGFFDSNFEPFVVDDTVVFSSNIDPNTYNAFLLAAYVATYVCGICTKHFEYNNNTPKIITSLARYHLYFTIKRFLRSPGKMNRYLTNEMRTLVLSNRPERYEWSKEFHQGKESVSAFLQSQPRGTVRNIKPVLSKYGGQVGINYEKRGVRTTNGHSNDKTTKSNLHSNQNKRTHEDRTVTVPTEHSELRLLCVGCTGKY